ncbi:MAG: putative lipid II flippase FtsW [Vicinamibacterales bacterium]
MARKLRSDRWLFVATVALVCASVVMVYSASAVMALERFDQPYLFLFKQAAWSALGLFFLGGLMHVDYRHYRQPVVVWTVFVAVTCALLAVLFGPEINGTRRWFGVAGIGVQPSELAKIAVIFFTAAFLETHLEHVNDLRRGLAPIALASAGLAALILLEPDFGTASVLLLTVAVMVFAAGVHWRYVAGLGVLMVPVLWVVIASAGYRSRRIMTFLDPWKDPLGDGFQIIQSLLAVGTGGFTGRGLMGGTQKLFFLPEPHTDFIYAVISEELGMIGATLVLMAFLVIAWRGLLISTAAPDRFGAFLALGLTTMIVLQAMVNISVVLGLLPTKGIPLPLLSAGGSSLLINLVAMGILLNVSQHGTESA